MLKKLSVLSLLLLTTTTRASTFTFDPARTVSVVGEIGGEALETADKIVALSKDTSKPIQLFINSPGGSVPAGMQIMAAMDLAKVRGATIQCFVSALAASMAFHILGACDERYGLRTSLFLWHPASVVGIADGLNYKQANSIAVQLKMLEDALNPRLIKALHISEEQFYFYNDMEALHPGAILTQISPKFVKLVDDVQGYGGPIFSMRGE